MKWKIQPTASGARNKHSCCTNLRRMIRARPLLQICNKIYNNVVSFSNMTTYRKCQAGIQAAIHINSLCSTKT